MLQLLTQFQRLIFLMKRKSNRIQSNSRARDKSNKRVRANNLSTHSTIRPNTTFRSVESNSRSMLTHSFKTSVPLKAAIAPMKSECSQKASRRSHSVEVLQNAPIIERAFCRSSSETSARPRCHMHEESTSEDIERWNALDYTPCDVVRECIECKYFHI